MTPVWIALGSSQLALVSFWLSQGNSVLALLHSISALFFMLAALAATRK